MKKMQPYLNCLGILLICVIAVVWVLDLLFPQLTERWFVSYEPSPEFVTAKKISKLHESCCAFGTDFARFPSTDTWIDELARSWGAQTEISQEERQLYFYDAWGRELRYRCPGRFNPGLFDIYSFGPDGVDNGGEKDDIGNWDGSFPSFNGLWDQLTKSNYRDCN